jgi:formylmethanofuran dehydrogenase subunit C
MTDGWRLTVRERPPLPIEVGSLNPQAFATLTPFEIERLPLAIGRRNVALAEIFKVEGQPGPQVIFAGPCERLDGIGRNLAEGEIVVEGDTGCQTGAGQSGGEIRVAGSVGDEAATGRSGGVLIVRGSAGVFLGAPKPGERLGMRGGLVHIGGDVGPRAGDRMRRGMILIGGNAGEACGSRMVAGTIAAAGQLGALPGLRMRRGTIIAGSAPEGPPDTFAATGFADLTIFKLLARRLAEMAPWLPFLLAGRPVRRAVGDLAVDGKGEILLTE